MVGCKEGACAVELRAERSRFRLPASRAHTDARSKFFLISCETCRRAAAALSAAALASAVVASCAA